MSHESVLADLAKRAPELPIIVVEQSTATVAAAASALGVAPGQIAKTLAIRVKGAGVLLVTRGDSRLDNHKTRAVLGGKPRMLDPVETLAVTGHAVGGVCPFGLANALPIYCDESLIAFPVVYPAGGSLNSSVEVSPARLAEIGDGIWVDICQLPEPKID